MKDIKLYNISETGAVGFSLNMLGPTTTNPEKVMGIWLKNFYGSDGGRALQSMRRYIGGNISLYELQMLVWEATLYANNRMIAMQKEDFDLADEDLFIDCTIKSLDKIEKDSTVSIMLSFTTGSGTKIIGV